MCARFEDDALEDDDRKPETLPKRTGPREVIRPITGHRVVARRPGKRSITTEDIEEMLEEFP